MTTKIKIGALVSGGGSNLQAIIDSCEKGTIDGRIVFVGSDNPAAGGLERAARHKIDTFVVDYRSIIGQYDHRKTLILMICSPNRPCLKKPAMSRKSGAFSSSG